MLCKIRHVRIEFDSPLSLLLAFQESAVNLCETGPLFSVPPPAAQHELVNWVGAAGWLGQIHLERYKRGKSECILLYYSIVFPLSHSLCLFSCIDLVICKILTQLQQKMCNFKLVAVLNTTILPNIFYMKLNLTKQTVCCVRPVNDFCPEYIGIEY